MTARAAPLRSSKRLPGGLSIGPIVAASLVGGIILVALSLPAGHGPMMPVRMAPAPIEVARSVRFEERGDGSLAVFDASNGVVLALLPAEQNGFLHALVHGLAATRRQALVPVDGPYSLSLYKDGRLVLADPPTKTSIDMEGFGPTNMHGVLVLLAPEGHHS